VAEGYNAMQFAGVGPDFPVLDEIREMYKKEGKESPKEMASTVYYNRGVLIAAIHLEDALDGGIGQKALKILCAEFFKLGERLMEKRQMRIELPATGEQVQNSLAIVNFVRLICEDV